MWDDFVQEETRLVAEVFGQQQQQQQSGQGDEDLALWTKGKKKVDRVPSLGPHHREERANSGQKRDMSKVKCFVCKLGHYAGQCPNRKKKRGGTTTTTEEA
jgi:hypothetical protein